MKQYKVIVPIVGEAEILVTIPDEMESLNREETLWTLLTEQNQSDYLSINYRIIKDTINAEIDTWEYKEVGE